MAPDVRVMVESWFTGGVVVSFRDQYGVEYRGALLKRTDETPEFKPSFRELASPLSVIHDHSYSTLGNKAWKKQLPAKVMCALKNARFPLTSEDIVCKRNGLGINFEKRAVVETDFVGYRSAKYHARQKIFDYGSSWERDKSPVNKHKRKKTSQQRKCLKKVKHMKERGSSDDLKSPTDSSYTSPLGNLDVSPSLISHAQNCTVDLTAASTVGVSSPLRAASLAASADSQTSSGGLSSRGSSLSPVCPAVKPFSIYLQRILPPSGATIILE